VTVVLGIRHGEVENPQGLVYGRLPGFGLSAAGTEAARHLGAALAGAAVAAVYASPLDRARATAAELAEPHGLPVLVEPRLLEWVAREEWQGRGWAALIESEEYRTLMADPSAPGLRHPVDLAGRHVLAWAEEAAALHADGVVLGVSHEAPLAAAYLVGNGGSFRDFRATNIPHLSGVRLVPGPPEMADPLSLLPAC
jgi:broad specificity phosphatase PhoE